MKKLAIYILHAAERLYLSAHGWKIGRDEDTYIAPEGFPAKHATYHRCHAVNAQRGAYAATTKATKGDQETVLMAQLRASVDRRAPEPMVSVGTPAQLRRRAERREKS